MITRAVLFDLGNTLVSYYTSARFPDILRRCLEACAEAGGFAKDSPREDDVFKRALLLNREREDYTVRPLAERLGLLFGPAGSSEALVAAFLKPIFETARLDPNAVDVLRELRARGIKTAIVSNTPWGSPAAAWREELERHGLLDMVDTTVFCMDVGFRKPHRAPFERALSLLRVDSSEAVFVGDDPRWDAVGAEGAGLRPVIFAPAPTDGSVDGRMIHDLRDVITLVESG